MTRKRRTPEDTPGSVTVRVKSLFHRFLHPSERRAVRQTTWLGARLGIQLIGGAASIAFSARTLGPEGFGALALIMTVTALVGGLLYLPGDEAIPTYVTRSLAQGRREEAAATLRFALGGAIGTLWLSYAVVAALALTAGGWIGIPDTQIAALLIYATVSIFQAGQQEFLAILRLADRVPLAVAAMAAGTLVQVTGLAVVWWVDGSLQMVTMAYAAAAGVYGGSMGISVFAAARRAGLPLVLRPFTLAVPRDVVRFQAGMFVKGSMRAIYLNLDVLLLAQLVSGAQLGLYRGARLLADIGLRAFPPLALSIQTEYSRYWYAADDASLRRMVGRSTLLALALATVGYGLLALFCQPLVRLVLGPDFAGAVSPLLIMIPGAFLFAGITALHVLPAATGRAWPSTLAEVLALAAQVVLLFLLTPAFGAAGAAWAYTLYSLAFAAVIVPSALIVLRRSSWP